jgi:RNA polymerase sigma-70 factor (ECF subfamily)
MAELMDKQEQSQALVTRAQNGDREAFDKLARRYRSRLVSLMRSRLGEQLAKRVDIDDLVQEVLLRAFSSLAQFRWSGDEALFRWLSVIARHVIQEVARREGRELLLPSEEDLAFDQISPARAIERRDRMARLRIALDGLKPDHRKVIILARVQRLPVRDVAERMGRTPKATTQLLLRALEKLKDAFGHTDSFSLPDESLLDEEGRAEG